MPWKIQDAGNGMAYVVNAETGKKMSNKPIPKARAAKQIKALYANANPANEKEVSGTPTGAMGHGAGGTFSTPGLGGGSMPMAKAMGGMDTLHDMFPGTKPKHKKHKSHQESLSKIANEAETTKGGPGSGNFGHAGRPGAVGGSAPRGKGGGGPGPSKGKDKTGYNTPLASLGGLTQMEYATVVRKMENLGDLGLGNLEKRTPAQVKADRKTLSKMSSAKIRQFQDIVKAERPKIWAKLRGSKANSRTALIEAAQALGDNIAKSEDYMAVQMGRFKKSGKKKEFSEES